MPLEFVELEEEKKMKGFIEVNIPLRGMVNILKIKDFYQCENDGCKIYFSKNIYIRTK